MLDKFHWVNDWKMYPFQAKRHLLPLTDVLMQITC